MIKDYKKIFVAVMPHVRAIFFQNLNFAFVIKIPVFCIDLSRQTPYGAYMYTHLTSMQIQD